MGGCRPILFLQGKYELMSRLKFILGSAVIAAGLAFLIFTSVEESAAHHVTLPQLLTQADDPAVGERRIQLGGCTVVRGSIRWDEYRHRPEFTVTDGDRSLEVRYKGSAVLPDTFQDRALVVLEGQFVPGDERFDADVIYAKCPSKYEGQSYDDHVEKIEPSSAL